MSEDLKGNTNFVFLKDLQDEVVVPRTNLAAVDMTVANGLAVTGSTLYVNKATTEDIVAGTSGSVVTPDVLKPILDGKQTALETGTGIEIVSGETASTISVPITDVETLIDGTTATKVVDVAALRGALTTGQAVDVTSAPDGVTGDYLGSFTVTGSSLGFAAFPKYAKNLNYLFIATIVPTTAGTVTPSANCKWLDTGDRTAKSVAAGVSVKLAVTFTSSANTCPASFALSGTGSVTVSYCRQYEVTACSAEAINYIASLSNPDAFADYYLVKADMVQPWTYIIDMGTSPAVTVAAGLSYKLNASTGTHTLTVDACPTGYDGRDAIIRIRLGGNGVVQAVAPLQLGGALVPYAINNCVVKFRDGEAVLLVEDTLAGYVVTVNSGTDSGSLAYGLAATGVPYIAFSTGTDGTPVQLENAVTANEEVNVVGNGYTNTTVTGNITCTNKTVFANIGLQDVQVTGGTLTLGDVFIPSGSTVAVSGGGLAVEKVTGNGGVIDLGGYSIRNANGIVMSGCVVTGGTIATTNAFGGAFSLTGGTNVFHDCIFSGNSAVGSNTGGAIAARTSATVFMTGCTFSDNYTGYAYGGGLYIMGTATLTDCTMSGNVDRNNNANDFAVFSGGVATVNGGTYGVIKLRNAELDIKSTVKIDTIESNYGAGTVVVSSGAVIDLTGNTNSTPVNPGGGITFEEGGATVLYSSGAVSGSYTMNNVTLPAGAKLTNTAVVDFGGEAITLTTTASASGCTFTSGGSAAFKLNAKGELHLSGVTMYGNNGNRGDILTNASNTVCTLTDCDVTSITMFAGSCCMSGSNTLHARLTSTGGSTVAGGYLFITSGAILDLTGNTNSRAVYPGSGVIVDGGCTVINSAGASVSIAGGTYTQINNDGTTE